MMFCHLLLPALLLYSANPESFPFVFQFVFVFVFVIVFVIVLHLLSLSIMLSSSPRCALLLYSANPENLAQEPSSLFPPSVGQSTKFAGQTLFCHFLG